jgi:hypothetical protein
MEEGILSIKKTTIFVIRPIFLTTYITRENLGMFVKALMSIKIPRSFCLKTRMKLGLL